MYVGILQLLLLSNFMGYSLALLHHGDPGTPNLDALLASLNERDTVPEPKITTRDLKTVILALQKDCTSRLNTLKSDFELSLKSQTESYSVSGEESSLPRKSYKRSSNWQFF